MLLAPEFWKIEKRSRLFFFARGSFGIDMRRPFFFAPLMLVEILSVILVVLEWKLQMSTWDYW